MGWPLKGKAGEAAGTDLKDLGSRVEDSGLDPECSGEAWGAGSLAEDQGNVR